jgi:hypothetical protein
VVPESAFCQNQLYYESPFTLTHFGEGIAIPAIIIKEAQLRAEFLDPFFEALGWDVTNRQGWAEAYKDVVQEDAVRVGGAMNAPDYAFRVGGARKFFV